MSEEAHIPSEGTLRRYDAAVRISDALSLCRDLEELSKTLAMHLSELLSFDHLDVTLFREDSNEIKLSAKACPQAGDEAASPTTAAPSSNPERRNWAWKWSRELHEDDSASKRSARTGSRRGEQSSAVALNWNRERPKL